ncbi:hypothetical protein DFP72DRAFT_1048065 [Ephemerocybe angulata]|uniref:Uncharacterized protein n=1 Tax=Ephemerocybe angulata TaxID=980116 RepID=A0A8H6M1I1_9AGAR|nr:hypothetical protein DFP72DRAFT_1048065 [Tulosesus angulatus]
MRRVQLIDALSSQESTFEVNGVLGALAESGNGRLDSTGTPQLNRNTQTLGTRRRGLKNPDRGGSDGSDKERGTGDKVRGDRDSSIATGFARAEVRRGSEGWYKDIYKMLSVRRPGGDVMTSRCRVDPRSLSTAARDDEEGCVSLRRVTTARRSPRYNLRVQEFIQGFGISVREARKKGDDRLVLVPLAQETARFCAKTPVFGHGRIISPQATD